MGPSPDCSTGHQCAPPNLAASSSLYSLMCSPLWVLLLNLDVVPRNLCSGMLLTIPFFIMNRTMLLDGLIPDVWFKDFLASAAQDPLKAGLIPLEVSHWFIRQCDVCAWGQTWPVNGGVGQTKAKEGHWRGEGWWWAKGEMRELCLLNLLPFKN